MARLLTLLLALPPGAAALPGADTPWSRVSTEHFVVSGDAPATAIGQAAARLESLRAVFVDALPRVNDRSLQRTFVIVFGSDRAFAPYRPADVTVGGFAVHEPFMPCLVLRSDRADPADDAFRTLVHEYVHVLGDEPWLPLWLIEGMADQYSVTTLSRDQRRAAVGERIAPHVAQAQQWWVPLSQVLDMPRTAQLANDQSSMSFDAEWWLLVHSLMRAAPEKGAQVARFIDLLSAGATEASAFEQAIGPPAKVEVTLRRYLGTLPLYGQERPVARSVTAGAPKPRPMTAAEVDATLGRLLFHLRRAGEERRPGLLDAVDCPGAEFIARVSTQSGPLSASTTSLAGVPLSSARDTLRGALPCGVRQGREPVYVTWKGDHQLVAIEFLPEDLQPGR